MQTSRRFIFIPHHRTQNVQALIVAKKLASLAQQQGYHSQVLSEYHTLDTNVEDDIILLGEYPNDISAELKARAIVLDVAQVGQQPEQTLAKLLNDEYTPATLNADDNTANSASTSSTLRFVAITACPTGVAHTFMSAEALQKTAEQLGYHIDVETQGSVGAKNILTADAIAQADYVILATDIEVDTARFAGKKIYRCSTGFALKQTQQAFADAIQTAQVAQTSTSTQASSNAQKQEKTGFYKHLMTGVSFMLPIVVAGGLLIALSFMFGITAFEQKGSMAEMLMQTGKAAFTLMIPILSGYIAYSIADRPGLAAGLIGGLLSAQLGAGFLGAIITGFIAGYSSLWLAKKLPLPQSLSALKPILIIPLLSSLLVGLLMFFVIGQPVADIFKAMEEFLKNMGTSNAVLLGVVIGAMMCVDMGGPINKAAYTFSVGLLTMDTPNQFPIAAAMASGMTPAIGMAIATWFAKHKFTEEERNAGKASFVLGLCFISEGAIPFAAKDPSRVIPSCIAGGAVAGALVALFHCQLAAPHGGVFVLLIPNAINHTLLYLLAILVGSAVTGISYAVLKSNPQPMQNVNFTA